MNCAVRTLLALALFSFCIPAFSQSIQNSEKSSVSFELNWPAADPASFQITVDASGNAHYRSTPHTEGSSQAEDQYSIDFVMSPANRERIFQLAEALDHFSGSFDYQGKTRIAQTGVKTLTYESGGKRSKTTYNWSENLDITELTSLFQSISSTFEQARKIDFSYRFDKIGLDKQITSLEMMEKDHRVAELQVVVPVLQKVANDRATMNITRQKAMRLLRLAGALLTPSAAVIQ